MYGPRAGLIFATEARSGGVDYLRRPRAAAGWVSQSTERALPTAVQSWLVVAALWALRGFNCPTGIALYEPPPRT
jgi:hypothetical protein